MKLQTRFVSKVLDYLHVPESLLRRSRFDLVLLYHSVERVRSGYQYSVSVDNFRQQLNFLTQTVEVVPLEVMMNTHSDHVRVAITFDDAYDELYTHVLPLLEEFDVAGTVFVPTAFVGRVADSETEAVFLNQKSFLNCAQISELHRIGRFRFESHTHTHIICDDASSLVADDIARSIEQLIEMTGRRPQYLAYPKGVGSAATHEIARGLGFDAVFSTERRRLGKGFVHGRYDITTRVEDLSQFKRNIAGFHQGSVRIMPAVRSL